MAFQVEASLLSVRIVLEGWLFGPRLFISFLSKKGYGSKVFSRNGQFSIDVPQGISQDDLSVS